MIVLFPVPIVCKLLACDLCPVCGEHLCENQPEHDHEPKESS